jgi:RNA polymerase subunit RPABC4/transcription elongation factor Spt4
MYGGLMNIEDYKCPTCDGYIPDNENIGKYSGALSRRDNKTEICSACGTREAMEDYFRYLGKQF